MTKKTMQGEGEGEREDSIDPENSLSGFDPTADEEKLTEESVDSGDDADAGQDDSDSDDSNSGDDDSGDDDSGESDQNEPEPSVAHPATTYQKIILAISLLAVTIGSLVAAGAALDRVQKNLYEPVEADWARVTDVPLDTGPVGFRYIRPVAGAGTSGKLTYVGTMSDETRAKLVALFPSAKNVDFESDEWAEKFELDAASYVAAIDKLSEESLLSASKYLLALLLLGGWCGMVGVQVRSMWDFVRNICFKDPPQLDVVTWWPWYLMRPIIGFVLGILAIGLITSGFLGVENQSPRDSLWWLSVTVLVGFGATEFMARLRLVVTALFAASG